jgi:protein-tyrosine phosphatase
MVHKLLFLCTGNYYRSRYAEILFNEAASEHSLDWKADSRGITAERLNNPGPISVHAVKALKAKGIEVDGNHRPPIQLREEDLFRADHIIAVKEIEHRPLLLQRFPQWADKVEYWHVHDLDVEPPEEALPVLEDNLNSLIDRLNGVRKAVLSKNLEPDEEMQKRKGYEKAGVFEIRKGEWLGLEELY